MSRALSRPDPNVEIAALQRRVGILERRTTPAAAPQDATVIFSHAGSLSGGTESPPVLLRRKGTLTAVAVAFGTAGTTGTTLTVKRNGTTVVTVTVPAGAQTHIASAGVGFSPQDRLSVAVVAAGSGAADMTVEARFV